MATPETTAYINADEKIVIPDCPEHPGTHSHWLPLDNADDDGNGSYTCDQYSNDTPPSGREITYHVDK